MEKGGFGKLRSHYLTVPTFIPHQKGGILIRHLYCTSMTISILVSQAIPFHKEGPVHVELSHWNFNVLTSATPTKIRCSPISMLIHVGVVYDTSGHFTILQI